MICLRIFLFAVLYGSASLFEIEEYDINFILHTRQQPEGLKVNIDEFDKLAKAINPNDKTKFLAHGGRGSPELLWIKNSTKAYLEKGNFNVIVIDWSKLAAAEPPQIAANGTFDVGLLTAKLIICMVESKNVSLDDIQVIGHSFGGLVAAFTGKNIFKLTGLKLGRITGLDPTTFVFNGSSEDYQKPTKNDAKVVDIIHTDDSEEEGRNPLGLIDFYPNGGVQSQPGCVDESEGCSHKRAAFLFVEEIQNEKGFVARKCDSMDDFRKGICENNEKVAMGGDLKPSQAGKYYLYTNKECPFSIENLDK